MQAVFRSWSWFLMTALLLWTSALPPVARADARSAVADLPGSVIVLCYHHIEDSEPDQRHVGVTTAKLVEQIAWLRRNGHALVSVDDIVAARDGRRPLPPRAVLLTFDDGYASFYTRAFPILKAYGAPAVLALVGEWMSAPPDGVLDYGGEPTPRSFFMTWDQVREVAASGLVEIAAHSHGLHRGVAANPQGNLQPAAVTRRYDAASGYEDEGSQRGRVSEDLSRIASLIEREVGRRPRVMVWPYGEHNGQGLSISAASGMPITFTLTEGIGGPGSLAALPRHLVANDPTLGAFVAELRELADPRPIRVAHVDLDYVHDRDPAQTERNLDALVQRIRSFEINTVYLQAFADPDGSGLIRRVYFPNRHLPLRADLFNRVAWQLRTRARVQVYAWMPVLAFEFPDGAGQRVLSWQEGGGAPREDPKNYKRLSLFDPVARRRIVELYADLAAAASFEGLLFHDDALLSDFEDASSPALEAYARAGLPASVGQIRADSRLSHRWAEFKTDALIDFTRELADTARRSRAPLRTARNMYARPVLEPASVAWFAQQYDKFLAAYDSVAIMAMPRMEQVAPDQAEAWLLRLVAEARARPDGLRRTVFELQAVDWRNKGRDAARREVPSQEIAGQMRLLARNGALNFGYYPDDFVRDHPAARVIHREFSLQSHPYR